MKNKFETLGIEILLQPSYPTTAFRAEYAGEMMAFFDYLNIWSALNFPVGVVPVGRVTE